MALTAEHQMFLQTLMCRGIMSAKEVKDSVRTICKDPEVVSPNNPASMANFFRTINTEIKQFHLVIKKGVDEFNGKHHYILINTMNNDITKKASDFHEMEIEYFKTLVSAIMESEDFSITLVEALNLHVVSEDTTKQMTKFEIQSFIKKLEQEKWIVKVRTGLTLGLRAITELEPYLKNNYEDYVKTCNICNCICIQGMNCERCDIRLHIHCACKIFSAKSVRECPNGCGFHWPDLSKKLSEESEAAKDKGENDQGEEAMDQD